MSTKTDKQQLVQNLYGLATKLGEAAQKSIDFATVALSCDAAAVETSGPKAKVVELGVAALKAGTEAARAMNETAMSAVELLEELEGDEEDLENADA
jgi:hypothetical protein